MTKSINEQISELEEAIRIQEKLRDSLGDEVVNATVAALQEKLSGLRSSRSEERKLVACLFCDLVGSTQLASERDPEEVLQIINGALEEMGKAVEEIIRGIAENLTDPELRQGLPQI
jgi:hypothetical protein